MHRRRIDGRGDVHEVQVGRAARDLQIADVAHERDVGVVDGDGQLDLIVERRGGGGILCLRGGPRRAGCGGEAVRWPGPGTNVPTASTNGATQNLASVVVGDMERLLSL